MVKISVKPKRGWKGDRPCFPNQCVLGSVLSRPMEKRLVECKCWNSHINLWALGYSACLSICCAFSTFCLEWFIFVPLLETGIRFIDWQQFSFQKQMVYLCTKFLVIIRGLVLPRQFSFFSFLIPIWNAMDLVQKHSSLFAQSPLPLCSRTEESTLQLIWRDRVQRRLCSLFSVPCRWLP